MSLPVTAEPLPSSYTFGKVVGRVIHLIADTAEDTDDKPQARAAVGRVVFAPKEVLRKTTVSDYPAIVMHANEAATLSSSGRVLDAEGRQGIWLAIGIYTVTFEITGAARAIPSFDIEVTAAHNDAAPLDLATAAPYVPPTGAVVQTLVVPSGGTTGQVLVRNASGGLEWADQSGGGTGAVASVNGQTGAVVLEAADVGAVPTADAVELAVTTARTLTQNAATTGEAADAGHTHRLPNAVGGDITLYQADGTATALHTVSGVVGGPVAVPAGITATGTASATTYLRGDGTWATPTGGGGGAGGGATHIATRTRLHMPQTYGGTFGASPDLTAGQSYGVPIFLPTGTVTRLTLPRDQGGAHVAGTARLGMFTLNPTDPAASTRLLDAGNVDLSNQFINGSVTVSQAVTEGWYLLAVFLNQAHKLWCSQNSHGHASFPFSSSNSVMPGYGYQGAAGLTTGFGTTFGGATAYSNMIPVVMVEMAA